MDHHNFMIRLPQPEDAFHEPNSIRLYDDLWIEFHTIRSPNQEWFDDWIVRVPNASCSCRAWILNYIKNHPPQFDGWDVYAWAFHNAVNAKLGNPQMSWPDYQACWLGIAPMQHRRLVITVATGPKFVTLLQKTRPLFESYALRCEADFVALTNKRHDQWQREKFRVFDFATQYEETLFLDVDCIVRPGTDNLFDECKGYDVGMHDDLPKIPATWDWRVEYRSVLKSQEIDLGEATESNHLWNSGVVYCTRQAAEIWRPPSSRLPDSHCSEQFFVQYQATRYKIKSLSSSHNWQYWFRDFGTGVDQAQIVHLANHPDKIAEVSRYLG